MWDKAELGWWYALGLYRYGPSCVEDFINQTFVETRVALVWLFLGAHNWFTRYSRRENDRDHWGSGGCCSGDGGCERDYTVKMVESLSKNDRGWTMRQIIRTRKAPEHGVCRHLGTNVFNYFVLHDFGEVDGMLCILLEEIIGSALQYLFEYAISTAIAVYVHTKGELSPTDFCHSPKYWPQLLRNELYRCALLGNPECKYRSLLSNLGGLC